MAGSGPYAPVGGTGAVGWGSGAGGWDGGPHNVFINRWKVTKLDDTPTDMQDLTQQRAKTLCEVCGEPVICDFWPTAEWRHMNKAEVAQYPIREASEAQGEPASKPDRYQEIQVKPDR
jgi:hypothetical protein